MFFDRIQNGMYDEIEQLKCWVKKMTCLVFVPIDKVKDLYCELCIQKQNG